LFFQLDANNVTQPQAIAACAAERAHLLSVHSEAERNFINDKYAANLMNRGGSVWIGLVDRDKNLMWTWTDNSTNDYTRWDRDQPNGAEDEEYCVTSRANGAWSDEACDSERGYICKQLQLTKNTTEKPRSTKTTERPISSKNSTGTYNDKSLCPKFWLAFEKSCPKSNANGGNGSANHAHTSRPVGKTHWLLMAFITLWVLVCGLG